MMRERLRQFRGVFAAASILGSAVAPAGADEPAAPLRVVTPRKVGIVAVALNGRGDLIGFEWVENEKVPEVVEQRPFLARGEAMTYLPLLKGYSATFPAGLSDDGVVVGRASKPAPLGVRVPLRNQAFVWDAQGGIRGLGTLEGDFASFATGISRDGRRIAGFSVGDKGSRACVWDRGPDAGRWEVSPLPHEAGLGSNVVALSGDGRRAAAVDGTAPCLWTLGDDGRWARETIGGTAELVPRAVNDAGVVVGYRALHDGTTDAVVWTRDRGCRAIPKPAGYAKSEALAVNNAGLVVGTIDGPNGSPIGPNAFAFDGERVRIIKEGGPFFTAATALNDRGEVAGVLEEPEHAPPAVDEPAEKGPPRPNPLRRTP